MQDCTQVFRVLSAQMGITAQLPEVPLLFKSAVASSSFKSSATTATTTSQPRRIAVRSRASLQHQRQHQHPLPVRAALEPKSNQALPREAGGKRSKSREYGGKCSILSLSSKTLNGGTSNDKSRSQARARAALVDQTLIGHEEGDATLTQEQAVETAKAMRREIKRAKRRLSDMVQLMRDGIRDVSAAVDSVFQVDDVAASTATTATTSTAE
jgi:hypothetical protein